MTAVQPRRTSPVFDEATLPAGLRAEHRTRPGVWGLIRVIAGEIRLTFVERGETLTVTSNAPALVHPQEIHSVEPVGPILMRIEFYDQPPQP